MYIGCYLNEIYQDYQLSKIYNKLVESDVVVNSHLMRNSEYVSIDAKWFEQYINDHIYFNLNLSEEQKKKYAHVNRVRNTLIKKMQAAIGRALIVSPIEPEKAGLFRCKENLANDAEKHVLSYLDFKSLLMMRSSSRYNTLLVSKLMNEFVDGLNSRKLMPKDLGLSKFEDLTLFFGDECSRIQRLDVRGLFLKNKKFNHNIFKVREIFFNINISDFKFNFLGKFQILESLHLENCAESDFSFISTLSGLKNLVITEVPLMNLKFLNYCKSVEKLALGGCSIIQSNFPKCPSLKKLNLFDHRVAANDQVEKILTLCPNLEELNISKTYIPNPYSIEQKKLFCPNKQINEINLLHQNAWPIRAIDLKSVFEYCPQIKTIKLQGIEIDEEELAFVEDRGVKVILIDDDAQFDFS